MCAEGGRDIDHSEVVFRSKTLWDTYEDNLVNTGRETFLLPVEWKDGFSGHPSARKIQFHFRKNKHRRHYHTDCR
jgi:beta-xylosidase